MIGTSNLHKCSSVVIVSVGGRFGSAPAVAAARRAALHALHLQPQPLVLVVRAHRQQLVDGRVHRPLVRAEHRLDNVVVHIREHRLEIGHRLRELELHRGRHRDAGTRGTRPGRNVTSARPSPATQLICDAELPQCRSGPSPGGHRPFCGALFALGRRGPAAGVSLAAAVRSGALHRTIP